ncbi:hypothetical protein [Actinoplanes philippinensis]|uniref:hypothetical protein n=1 Tax=Actinoplanes philippinensis TaxID=35752 RepID=UPI0011600F26|nr:hypothetical protein [Actinoplanes philippinensis]
MSTDIYGAIEVYQLAPHDDPADIEPWTRAIDLYPLYPYNVYLAFGCLFGVRNRIGWEPVAARRGLPADVSASIRTEFENHSRGNEAVGDQTWVSWAELKNLDMTVTPGGRGVLRVRLSGGGCRYTRVDDEWPAEIVTEYGVPPLGPVPAEAAYGSWQVKDVRIDFLVMTRNDVLGPGSGWEHVFGVMRALAGRFGDDGVRLVAWFD